MKAANYFLQQRERSKNAIIWTDTVTGDFCSQTLPGREGIKDYILDVLHKALADIEAEIFDQVAEGHTVVTRKAISGMQLGEFLGRPATNERIMMLAIDIVKLRDGQYVEHWRYGQVLVEERRLSIA